MVFKEIAVMRPRHGYNDCGFQEDDNILGIQPKHIPIEIIIDNDDYDQETGADGVKVTINLNIDTNGEKHSWVINLTQASYRQMLFICHTTDGGTKQQLIEMVKEAQKKGISPDICFKEMMNKYTRRIVNNIIHASGQEVIDQFTSIGEKINAYDLARVGTPEDPMLADAREILERANMTTEQRRELTALVCEWGRRCKTREEHPN
jgi:hypothetical protein